MPHAGKSGNPQGNSIFWDRFLLGSIPFLILALIWVLLVKFFNVGPVFLPPLEEMPKVLFRMFFPVRTTQDLADHTFLTGILFRKGSILWDVGVSSGRIFCGFILTILLATPLGILIGYSKTIQLIFSPIIGFIRYMPVPVFIPLCILWFGSGDLEKVAVIFAGGFFQLALLVADAAALVRSDYYEAATMLGAPRHDLVFRVLLPAALPQIFDGFRICLGWAWTYLLVAEILGATSGVGYYVTIAQRYVMVPQIFASMLIIGCLGMGTDLILARLHRTLFPWVEKKTDLE
jgi:NitT/TauT family transport system permease protein